VHDMRRTFISLARAAGVEKDLLRRATRGIRGRDVMELYTSVEWELLCSELSKLRVHRREARAVAAGADEFADPSSAAYRRHTNEPRRLRRLGNGLGNGAEKAWCLRVVRLWRRRESKERLGVAPRDPRWLYVALSPLTSSAAGRPP